MKHIYTRLPLPKATKPKHKSCALKGLSMIYLIAILAIAWGSFLVIGTLALYRRVAK